MFRVLHRKALIDLDFHFIEVRPAEQDNQEN